jgi:hypothetical protein
MKFLYGEIDKEYQDNDGTDRFEGVKLDLKQAAGVARRRL